MSSRRLRAVWVVVGWGVAIGLVGCTDDLKPRESYPYTAAIRDLPRLQKDEIRRVVAKYYGTANEPKMYGGEANRDPVTTDQLREGARLYGRYCQSCHGYSGGGDGPAAEGLVPRPRNFHAGQFKFKSTPQTDKPLRSDIAAIIKRGAIGTSMPSFDILTDKEIGLLTDYVIYLTHRGELETRLAKRLKEAEELGEKVVFEGEANPDDYEVAFEDVVKETVDRILTEWAEAPSRVIIPEKPMPTFTTELLAQGKELFVKNCASCHGPDGRGQVEGNETMTDDGWGRKPRVADLTAGMFHGGPEPIDIYRRIAGGIYAPMPQYSAQLTSEEIWSVVGHVLNISNQRRRGEQLPAGRIIPIENPRSRDRMSDPSSPPPAETGSVALNGE
ncbi:cytochrome c class I [Isosphaera pallida ATCC 43644]|uniref:Cytochrome c class I n=1 Tax=Isosphaera pallida (strain ATCC 43644 / DSM 9630 / IS1B) TaxID=575540 RepID=E8R034_ISOPI|nr:cytochrome c [Isosphaera pallida]ADV61152.1 cytochrome c class I [Isosphaera pallida ATCC 43644]